MSASPPREWSAILADAVAKPGVVSEAYREFWNYSVGNQLLALFQCFERELPLGPIHTFLGWKELGRHVKRGEKAISLCMPVTCKSRAKPEKTGETEDAEGATYTRFIYRSNWFVLGQTDGKDYVPTELPDWQESRALVALDVERVDFHHLDGNAQGYAVARAVAVSPVAFMPHRTMFHELAHVVLGHTAEHGRMDDGEGTPVNLREVEAESVALICCESLGLDGAVFSRGYIQHWLRGEKAIPERSAQKVFGAADKILKAGLPETAAGSEENQK